MVINQEFLFQLKHYEFEELCVNVISDILPVTNIRRNVIVDNHMDIDIMGDWNDDIVLVEIKHKLRINKREIEIIFNKLLASNPSAKYLVLMTSASLKDVELNNLNLPTGHTYTYIGADDILKALNYTHPDLQKLKEVKEAEKRTKKQSESFKMAIIAMIVAILGSLFSSYLTLLIDEEKQPLEKRIETVETVIGNLKDLEIQLKDIKEDMVKTQQAKDFIEKEYEKEYEKMQEVKKLSKIQIEAIKESMEKEEWWIMLIKNVLSFILGVASSIAGSILYSKYKQRKSLED